MKQQVIKIKNRTIIKILCLIILVLAGIMAYQLLYKPSSPPVTDATDLATREREELIMKVGSHIVLPKDEVPTVATVLNADQLRQQPFFQNALNGDKVLIYSLAKVAVLYRPSEDRIIEKSKLNTEKNENNLLNTNSTSTKK